VTENALMVERSAITADRVRATLTLHLDLAAGAPQRSATYVLSEAQALELMAQLAMALVRPAPSQPGVGM
jgi:hypothetical protein